jgi:hypothetical protein
MLVYTSHICRQATGVNLCLNRFDLCLTYITARTTPCKLQTAALSTTRILAKVLLQYVCHISMSDCLDLPLCQSALTFWWCKCDPTLSNAAMRCVFMLYAEVHHNSVMPSWYDLETHRTLTELTCKVYDSIQSVLCMLALVIVFTILTVSHTVHIITYCLNSFAIIIGHIASISCTLVNSAVHICTWLHQRRSHMNAVYYMSASTVVAFWITIISGVYKWLLACSLAYHTYHMHQIYIYIIAHA